MDTIAAIFDMNWIDMLVVIGLCMSAGALAVGLWNRLFGSRATSVDTSWERRAA